MYCRILAGLTIAIAVAWVALSHNAIDRSGRPLGTDFLSFWAASKLALSGNPAGVYNLHTHYLAQRAAFGGAETGYSAFFYPPVYLILCLPLALLPYLVSLAVWLGATGYAYWQVVRRFLGDAARDSQLAALAFPAVLITVGHGQNAFLTTALFGGGALCLRKRPILAGLCFGALVFKPHLGILIPIALIAAHRWKTFAAASLTVIVLGVLSLAMFGIATWEAFFHVMPLARQSLEEEWVGSAKMQSVFAAVRVWHGGLGMAYGVQGIAALAACAALVRLARRQPDSDALGPALIAATFLASPFLLDYDLTLLAVPLAFVFAEARRTGFLPWEKIVLAAAFVLPLVSRNAAAQLALPLGPPVIAALFAIVLRRSRAESDQVEAYPAFLK